MKMEDLECYVDVELLDKQEQQKIEKILAKHVATKKTIPFDGEWVRFWGRDEKTVQLDGDFCVSELSLLIKMMEAIKK